MLMSEPVRAGQCVPPFPRQRDAPMNKKRTAHLLGAAALVAAATAWAGPPSAADLPGHAPPFQGARGGDQELIALAVGGYRIVGTIPTSSGPIYVPSAGQTPACDAAPVPIIQTNYTYHYLAGICDDDSADACAGRVTTVIERCGDGLSVGGPGIQTGLLGTDAHGRYGGRICFDPTGDSTCDAPDADTVVIARLDPDTARAVNTRFASEPYGEIQATVGLTDLETFRIDGRRVRLSPGLRSATTRYRGFSLDGIPVGCGRTLLGEAPCEQTSVVFGTR